MAKIYQGQSAIRIRLLTETDLTGNLETKIRIKDPDDVVATVNAAVEDLTEGILYYDVPNETTLSKAGFYLLNAQVKFADARVGYGETVALEVKAL